MTNEWIKLGTVVAQHTCHEETKPMNLFCMLVGDQILYKVACDEGSSMVTRGDFPMTGWRDIRKIYNASAFGGIWLLNIT